MAHRRQAHIGEPSRPNIFKCFSITGLTKGLNRAQTQLCRSPCMSTAPRHQACSGPQGRSGALENLLLDTRVFRVNLQHLQCVTCRLSEKKKIAAHVAGMVCMGNIYAAMERLVNTDMSVTKLKRAEAANRGANSQVRVPTNLLPLGRRQWPRQSAWP